MFDLEVVDIVCKKENLLDYMWLFNNIPWSNHDNKCAKISFDEPIEIFYIAMNGSDTQTAELKTSIFDNVKIIAVHGFGGNSFSFTFSLGDVEVFNLFEHDYFAFDINEIKNRFINKLEKKIKGFEYHISYTQKAIDNFKNIPS